MTKEQPANSKRCSRRKRSGGLPVAPKNGPCNGWGKRTIAANDWGGELNGEFRNWGHVGLTLEDGRGIHAWDKVRIDDYSAVAALSVPPGSTPLRYRG